MRSIRLEEQLEQRLQQAAAREGVSVSEFIRRAIAARIDVQFSQLTNLEILDDIIGAAPSGTPTDSARRSREAFAEIMDEKYRRDQEKYRRSERLSQR